jgi:hypothetical protein
MCRSFQHLRTDYLRLRGAREEMTYSVDLPRLLRLSDERRKSETDSENDREPDQRHLGGGWLAAV